MAERVRITNMAKHDIGLVNQTGIEYNIKPGMFITLGKDDAEYMAAMARRCFANGKLVLGDAELAADLGLTSPDEVNPNSEEAVRKALSGNVNALKKYVKSIQEESLIEVIWEVAGQMDLPSSKMTVLKEAFPQKFVD